MGMANSFAGSRQTRDLSSFLLTSYDAAFGRASRESRDCAKFFFP
jgi:hypothetical protein